MYPFSLKNHHSLSTIHMKIVLSPAKSIDYKPIDNLPETGIAPFLSEAERLIKKLQKMTPENLSKLMGISAGLAEMNAERYQNWESPLAISDKVFPAIAGFNGEVYRGVGVRSLSKESMEYLGNNLRILSGLYGILSPTDLIYPYRLEMGTKLDVTPTIGNLYTFWGSKISEFLNKEMEEGEALINLASIEYFKAIDKKTLNAHVITPVFKEFRNGELKVVMTYAKNARGAMTRYMANNQISNPEELKGFDYDRYSFDVNASTESEWVFTR
jgi:cytoplasmic iron level regulating protein YaaA (DUF328/UPF0246 family)